MNKKNLLMGGFAIVMAATLAVSLVSCGDNDDESNMVSKVTIKCSIDSSPYINPEYVALIEQYLAETFYVSFENTNTQKKVTFEAKWNSPIDVNLAKGDYIVRAFADVQPISGEKNCTIMRNACFEVIRQNVHLGANNAEVSLKPDLNCSLIIVPEPQNGNWSVVQEFYGKSYSSSPHQYEIMATYDFPKDNKRNCYYAFTKHFSNTSSFKKFVHLERKKDENTIFGYEVTLTYAKNGCLYLYDGDSNEFKEYEIESPI